LLSAYQFKDHNENVLDGCDFKYYKELALVSFIIDVTESKIFFKFLKKNKGQNLEIYNNNSGKAYKSIPLKDISGIIEYDVSKIEDYFSVSMTDFNKHVDEKSFLKSVESININNNGDNPPLQHTTNKPRILLDKEIVNLSLVNPSYPDLGKVLNRGLAMQKTRDNLGNPGQIFADVTAGTSIPFPNGVGKAKTFIVDKSWSRIIMMDRDIVNGENKVAYAYPEYPLYSLLYPTDIATGAKRFKDINSVRFDSIVSIYVSDLGHNRIIRLDYEMQYILDPNDDLFKFNTSRISDQSFRVLTECDHPYSISIHPGINGNPKDSSDDVLWFSEGLSGNKRLVCVNAMTGTQIQTIQNVGGTTIRPTRISTYRSPDGLRNLLAFIDETYNALVVLKLEPNGQFINVAGNVRYFQDFGFLKLNSVLLTSYNNGVDGTTIWVTGDGGPGGCDNGSGAHCGYISTLNVKYINNFPANVEYLATCWSGFNSPSSFVNLQNIHANNGYIDLATMEKWTDNYGLRRYKPGIDTIGKTTLSTYCTETGQMTYSIGLTNPSHAFITAERKPAGGQWTSVQVSIAGYTNWNTNTGFSLPSGRQNLSIRINNQADNNGQNELMTDYDEIRIYAKYLPADEYLNSFDPNHLITMQPITTNVAPCNQSGGCPFVFVNNGSEFVQDNNILHRSEFDENIGNDIEDKYMLRVTPVFSLSDSICEIKIKELNNDISYFDKFSLVAIDHPIGTSLGITEENNYVLYFPQITNSPDHAEHEGEDVTSELSYDSNYSKTVSGDEEDYVSATYEEKNYGFMKVNYKMKEVLRNSMKKLMNGVENGIVKNYNLNKGKRKSGNISDLQLFDSVAIILDPSQSDIIVNQGPPIKKPAGIIYAVDNLDPENPTVEQFAKRQNTSPVIITIGKNANIDSLYSVWNSEFNISYLSVTPVYYGGYVESALELVEAIDSVSGNVLISLLNTDSIYSVMDSTTNITLKFKNNIGNVEPGFIRDYVLVTNGRYENSLSQQENRNAITSGETNITGIPDEYKLYQNYPNPFNPVTKIKYDLPKEGLVSIKIYNILGKEVFSIKEFKEAGFHNMQFSALRGGMNLSSGIYFYRISAGSFVQTKRMVLLK